MSGWLKGLDQVSNLIEKLDDKVAFVAEERSGEHESHDISGIGEILSKRGFTSTTESEGDDLDGSLEGASIDLKIEHSDDLDEGEACQARSDTSYSEHAGGEGNDESGTDIVPGNPPRNDDQIGTKNRPDSVDKPSSSLVENNPSPAFHKAIIDSGKAILQAPKAKVAQNTGSKESQREIRTLRKHVVRMNETLDQAESEIAALRAELDVAANRMEDDRRKAKVEKETFQKQKKEELRSLREEHELDLRSQKQKYEGQIDMYINDIEALKKTMKEEGGNWSKEATRSMEREQATSKRVEVLQEEKVLLLDQISTLQKQQSALASRIDSLSHGSEAAEMRAREADERLDAMLDQHARQISLRQSREAELERTIQELNTALVNKAVSDKVAEPVAMDSNQLSARDLEKELQSVQLQLLHEQEKGEILRRQLREMSKESASEASISQTLEMQHQRENEDLKAEVFRLRQIVRDVQKHAEKGGDDPKIDEEQGHHNESHALSAQVLKLRDKLAQTTGELKALKPRLAAAIARATKAEDELAAVKLHEMESAVARSSTSNTRRRQPMGGSSLSIRTAIQQNLGQNNPAEKMGNAVDALDAFSVSTGKYLRRNPLARAGFILYFFMIHIWSFVLLSFHAHHLETSSYGHKPAFAVGPDSLVKHHEMIADQAAMAIRFPLENAASADKVRDTS